MPDEQNPIAPETAPEELSEQTLEQVAGGAQSVHLFNSAAAKKPAVQSSLCNNESVDGVFKF